MSNIPDPTDLRKKLGIQKIKPMDHSIAKFAEEELPALIEQAQNAPATATLADYEYEPRFIDTEESAKIDEILANCPDAAPRWLKKYIVLGNKSAASRAIGYSNSGVTHWVTHYPEFRALKAFYDQEVRDRWNELMERRALVGFKEEIFKPDGSLKYTKLRQDPQFHVQLMKRIDPDWKDDNAGPQINITIERTEE